MGTNLWDNMGTGGCGAGQVGFVSSPSFKD